MSRPRKMTLGQCFAMVAEISKDLGGNLPLCFRRPDWEKPWALAIFPNGKSQFLDGETPVGYLRLRMVDLQGTDWREATHVK